MEVRVGQWVRSKGNKLYKVKMYPNNHYDFLAENTTCMIPKKYITKVADTPQELIEVGDLVLLHHYKLPRIVDEEDCKILKKKYWQQFITKILTPNSNGGYDLQWEKNN